MKQLQISDYPDLKRFFKRSKYRLCEYSLPLIVVWSNDEYQPYGSIDGDVLIVGAEFTTRKENRHLLLPISPSREYTPEELRDLAVNLGFQDFWFVPEDYIEKYGKRQIKKQPQDHQVRPDLRLRCAIRHGHCPRVGPLILP